MENPRPAKVAVVDEVREKFDATSAAILTEYRGLNVGQLAELRTKLRDAGGEFKVYKNTLVRFAARDLGLEIEELLTGPTAIAFVTEKPSGEPGDAVEVAKAIRDYGRDHPALVVKGGMLGANLLSADDTKALADVEPREVLLAKLAGGIAAPMQKFAGLLQALPRNFAYGLKALIDQGGADGAPEAPVQETPAEEATAETADEATAEAPQESADTAESTETESADTESTDTETTEAADAAETNDTPEAAETPAASADNTES